MATGQTAAAAKKATARRSQRSQVVKEAKELAKVFPETERGPRAQAMRTSIERAHRRVAADAADGGPAQDPDQRDAPIALQVAALVAGFGRGAVGQAEPGYGEGYGESYGNTNEIDSGEGLTLEELSSLLRQRGQREKQRGRQEAWREAHMKQARTTALARAEVATATLRMVVEQLEPVLKAFARSRSSRGVHVEKARDEAIDGLVALTGELARTATRIAEDGGIE